MHRAALHQFTLQCMINRSRILIITICVVPVITRIDEGISRIFPHFYNCFRAIAVRVPVINVTAMDLSVVVEKESSISAVNQLLKNAATGFLKSIIDYTELPLVSVDFNHNSHSVIVDGTQTRVSGGHLIKTLLWCDNEWGFANRMLDTVLLASGLQKAV